jgi:hypothetical protein
VGAREKRNCFPPYGASEGNSSCWLGKLSQSRSLYEGGGDGKDYVSSPRTSTSEPMIVADADASRTPCFATLQISK